MPLDFKTFTSMLRGLPADASDDAVSAAAHVVDQGTPLTKVWNWANKPLVGGEDSPLLAHKHGPDESGLRTTAEDLAAGFTSPLNLAVTATGVGGAMAGARGALGISQAARAAEGALQVPWALEGIKKVADGDSLGDVIGGTLEAGMAAHGIGKATSHAFPPAKVVKTYMEEKGLQPRPREAFNPEAAKVTADQYEGMAHEPEHPKVKASYASLKGQVDEQYKFLAERAGVTIEPWTGKGEPYSGSKAMQEDIRKNNHLWFLPTDSKAILDSPVPNDHPMMTEEAGKALPNDQFRAVHDYFGHASEGNTFSAKGEQEAFNAHRDTLTDDAHGALATETKGQNSWVNSGRHLRNPDGTLPQKGQPGYVSPAARPFAEQKAGLLPEYLQQAEREVLPQGDELARGVAGVSTPRIEPIDGAPSSPAGSQPLSALSDELAGQINESHQKGGSTTSLTGGKLLGQEDGRFMLSPYEDRQLVLDHAPSPQDLRNYIAKNEDLLTKPGHNLGTWWNKDGDGKHYLDVSITENDPQKALALGRQHKQLAIYDMAEGKDVPVPNPDAEVSPHKDAELSNMRRNAPFGEGSIMPNSLRPSEFGNMGLAVASPAASAAIDDSDPNDPNYNLKHYGKLALNLAGAAGLAATGMAAIRKNAIPLPKDAAAHGAALMILGEPKKVWAQKIQAMGIKPEELPKIRQASELIFQKQLEKASNGLPKVKRLLAFINEGKGDADWYDTHQELQNYFGKDAPVVANLIAATSNNSTVKSNLTLALKAYAQHKANPEAPIEGIMKTLLPAVDKARSGEPLMGRKVDNFAKALLGDPDAVVVDRWMMRAFGYTKDVPTTQQYDVIEHAVKRLAEINQMEPRQVQAAIWFGVKNRAEAGKNRPDSPAYGAVLKNLFGDKTDVPQALQAAVDAWKAKPEKGFGNTLRSAVKDQAKGALPF